MSRVPQLGRRALLAGLGAGLSGCGFRPVYAPRAGLAAGPQQELGAIDVALIPDRPGQLLRQALQERLDRGGMAEAKRYQLSISYNLSGVGVGVQPDTSVTRLRLTSAATWTLRQLNPGQTLVANGTARALDGYNVLDQQYFAADMENESADRRLAEALADEVVLQIASYFARHARAAG